MSYFITISLHLICLILTAVCGEKPCKVKVDCSQQMKDRACSFCTGNKGSTKCVYPFTDVYESSETHFNCDLVSKCKSNYCKNGGSCIMNKGVGYVCICTTNYFGKNCELKHDSRLHSFNENGFHFSIVGSLRRTYNYFNELLFTKSKTSKWMPAFVVLTNEGYFSLLLKDKKNFNKFMASVVYPFKAYEEKDNFMFYENNVLGYITTLQIRGYDHMVEIYRNSYQVFVSYDNVKLECMPVIKLRNCGSTLDTATVYIRKSEIIIKAQKSIIPQGNLKKQTNPVPNCDPKRNKIDTFWEVYQIGSNDEGHFSNPMKRHNDNSFQFKPFELDFGCYWVHVDATIVREKLKSCNTACGFFKIISLALQPNIEKGSTRFIRSISEGWIMNAKHSRDPNGPPDKKTADSLMTAWSCTSNLPKSTIEDICQRKIFKSTTPYVIPQEKIPDKGIFNFTLEIWSILYENCASEYCYEASKHRFINQVVIIDIIEKAFLYLGCEENCLEPMMVYRDIVFKAKVRNIEDDGNVIYNWTYNRVGSKIINAYIKEPACPSYIFHLPANVLESGVEYTVNVTALVGKSQLFNSFSFATDTVIYSDTCRVMPEQGVKGETYFDIYCPTSDHTNFLFEFHDTIAEESQFSCQHSGRMLGDSLDGKLSHVQLTRGVIDICISYFGFYSSRKIVVKLSEPRTHYDLTKYIKELNFHIQAKANLQTLQLISLISDIVDNKTCNHQLINFLLEEIDRVPIKVSNDVKLHSMTLNNVLKKTNQLEFFFSDISTMVLTKKIIFDLSKYFNQLKDNFLYFDITNMTKTVLDSLQLSARLESKLPNKFSLSNLDTRSLYEVSKTFIMAEETLNNIRDVISYTQMPGLPMTNIISSNKSLELICFKDDPHFDYTLLNMLQSYSDSPVIMTDDLYRNIDSAIPWPGSLTFTIISMKENIIHQFNNDSAAKLLYLSLGKSGADPLTENLREVFVNRLNTPIEMKLNVRESQLKQSGNWEVKQLDPGMEEEKLDLLMTIFRLEPEPSSLMVVTFLFPPSNSSFRVFIMKDYRPSYEIVLSKHKEINEKNSSYSFHCSRSEDGEEKHLYYLAILPGHEVPVNESVIFAFSINNKVCRSWSRLKWSVAGCDVGDKTRGHQVHCQCTHLSIFEAINPYLPTKVNPFSDAKLFLTVLDNPLVVCLMLTLLVLYLILSIWSYRMDKLDRYCSAIVVLEDNFPGDENAYLLVVCTSSRLWAGTSANVGIILEGEEGSSRAHILKSSRHQTLNRDSDCWFLLFSPKPLGLLQQIHIWHDNTGFFPSWYCNEIHVYDLAVNIETIFIVNQWLELSRENYPEAVILPATLSDILSPSRLFFNNFINGFKSKQSLVGVFTKHSRSTVTRVELLNASMCSLMISLLCSIMFYRDPEVNTDDFTFSLKKKEAVVSIITLIVSSVLSYVIGFEFHKSYEITHQRNQSSLFLRGSQYEEYYYSKLCDSKYIKKKQKKNSIMMKTFKTILNPAALVPAKLAGENTVIKVRRCWLILAWLTCIVIILSSIYIIMLCGLKLGLVKSKKWVASVFMSMLAGAVCISPLMLIAVSVALTSTFNLLVTTTNYQLTQRDVLLSLSQNKSDGYVLKLLKKRSHPKYFPPTDEIRAEIIDRQKRLYNLLDILQFCLFVTFMIITYYLAHLIFSSHYYVNSHLAKFIILPRFTNIGFFEAQNTSEMNKYAETTFLQALYHYNWYDGQVLEKNKNPDMKYWASDFTWKMFGLPIIRQLRVSLKSCKNKLFTNISKCIPPWSPSSEDEDRYNVGWLPYTWKDTISDFTPWEYKPPSLSWFVDIYQLYGSSGTMYNNGGYIALLNPTVRESLGTISDLTQNSWQDQFTRVLFMELTFCHTNSQILSKVTLITEYLVSSVTLKTVHIKSAVECSPWKFSMTAFTLFLFIFFLELCYKINRNGFHCLKDRNNIVLLTIAIVGCIVVSLRLINSFQCMWYSFNERNNFSTTSYFDYDSFLIYYEAVGSLLTVPLAASIFRVIGYFRGGNTWNQCNKTLRLSLNGIICLQLVLFFYFVCTWIIFLQTNLYLNYGSFIEITLRSKNVVSYEPCQMTIFCITLKVLKFLLSSIISSCFLIVLIHFRGISQSEQKQIS